jgi:hypothetical protein
MSVYSLPASKDGKIVTLRIENQVQHQFAGSGMPSVPTQIPAFRVADDVARSMTMGMAWPGMPANAQPGIWVADEPEPTEEQIRNSERYRRAVREQDAFLAAMVKQADDLNLKGQRNNIGLLHRVAAQVLGVTGRPWQEELRSDSLIDCPWCKSKIPTGALRCQFCGEIVDQAAYQAAKLKEKQAGLPGEPPRKPTHAAV